MLLQFGKGRRPLLVDFSLNVAPAFLTRSCVVVSDDPALINKLTFQKLINRPPMFGPTMFINLSVQHIFSLYISTYSESTTEIITLAAARNISIFSDKTSPTTFPQIYAFYLTSSAIFVFPGLSTLSFISAPEMTYIVSGGMLN